MARDYRTENERRKQKFIEFHLWLPLELNQSFSAKLKQENTTVSDFFREAVEKYLETNDPMF